MRFKNSGLLLALALAAVTLVYSNHFHNSFHFDDSHSVTDNPYVRDLRNVPKFFMDATTSSILPTNQAYRPVVSTSLAIDYWLGHGYDAVWFQVSTFFWFLVQLIAMYALFDYVVKDRIVAVFAVTLYGVHPAIAETVNYIVQRADVYSTLGVVAGLALYALRPAWRRTGLYLLPAALAMLSKPVAIVFPALLLLHILYFEKCNAMVALRKAAPSFAVCGGLAWFGAAMMPKTFVPGIVPGGAYRLTQPYVWLRYFGAFFLPVHLSADTDLQAFTSWNMKAAVGVLFVITLFAAIWITARRPTLRPISFGLAWFVVALVPTSIYPLSEVENDHRMYFPFVGLALALSWSIAMLSARAPQFRRAIAVVLVCALAAYGWGTRQRNEVWRSEESLWRDVTVKSPHNGRGLMNYGLTQMSQGRYAAALGYFERAAVFNPSYYVLEINLGVVNGALGRASEAEQHFKRALALAANDAQPYYYYARWLVQAGRPAEALGFAESAVRLNPSWVESRSLLMRLYVDSGDLAGAQAIARGTIGIAPGDRGAGQFLAAPTTQDATYWVNVSLWQYRAAHYQECINAARRALNLKPDSFEAYNNIGSAYAALGQWDLAIQNIRKSLSISPGFAAARGNLESYTRQKQNARAPSTPEDFLNASLQYHAAGRYKESIAAAQAALRLRPGYAEAYNNIAAAYEAMQQWDEAIVAASEAIRLKPDFALARNNLNWALQQKQKSGH